jgi:hypothetical protein
VRARTFEKMETMALPQLLAATAPEPYRLADARIRRCAHRRVVWVADGERGYEVHCLHPSLGVALPIGDMATATDVCNACTAPGIFRPDED